MRWLGKGGVIGVEMVVGWLVGEEGDDRCGLVSKGDDGWGWLVVGGWLVGIQLVVKKWFVGVWLVWEGDDRCGFVG